MLKQTIGGLCALAFFVGANSWLAAEDARPEQHFRARQILGSKVWIAADREVGVVEDIVLDDHGNVDYLVVTNSENKLVTVPWDAAQFDPVKRRATVRITQDQFQEIPTYTPETYPVYSTPAYRTQIYRYYGLTPGQERRLIRRGTVAP